MNKLVWCIYAYMNEKNLIFASKQKFVLSAQLYFYFIKILIRKRNYFERVTSIKARI
jgi:hypothetical protein